MWPGFESWRRHHMWVEFVCCWFSPLLREVFLRVLQFSPLLKNQHFQIPIRSGTHGHVSTSSYELLSAPWVNKLQFTIYKFTSLGVWISDETLLLVFDFLLLGVWISDEILLLVFDILLHGRFGYQTKNTPTRVWYISPWCLDIRWNTPFSFWCITSRFLFRIKHPISCLLSYDAPWFVFSDSFWRA